MKRCAFVLFAFLLAPASWHQAVRADAGRYTIENLGNLAGAVPAITGMNASGQISGYVDTPDGTRAVRYANGAWSLLPGLESVTSVAYGINASGDVVGYRLSPSMRAFRYRDGVGAEDILPLDGGSMNAGFAINNAGVVVGYSDSGAGIVAFSAAPGGLAVALPTLGGFLTVACGINDAGQIAGSAYTPDSIQHAIRIEPGAAAATDLGTFAGATGSSSACAIDAEGRVGGMAEIASGTHAYRFGAAPTDLDAFNSPFSNTESVAAGTAVGYFTAGDGTHAFVHTDVDGTSDLNTLVDESTGWVLTNAKAVNANGTIVGEGTFNGQPALFRLTKVVSTPVDTVPPSISAVAATPSRIWPPNGKLVPVTVAVTASDDSNAAPVCTLTGITATAPVADDFATTGPLAATLRAVGGRSYTLTVTCADAAGNSSQASTVVEVPPDTKAPVISQVAASPSLIWPPNGKMVPVAISVTATDDVTVRPVCVVKSISGADAKDYAITGPLSAQVRAEKNNAYTVNIKCSDAAGNRAYASVTVAVSNKEPQLFKAVAMAKKLLHSRRHGRRK